MPTAFASMTTGGQVGYLRARVPNLLKPYGLEASRVRLLSHGFNTVFRIDTTNNLRFVLRVNVNSKHADAEVRAEIAWLTALADETELIVPRPVAATDGSVVQSLDIPGVRDAPCVLFTWLRGSILEDRMTPVEAAAFGRIAATLHHHAASYRLPEHTSLPVADQVLFGLDNVLFESPDPRISASQAALFEETHAVAQATLDTIFARTPQPRPMHLDMHDANFMSYRGHVAVFDFDDAGLGHPIQDPGITFYYFATERTFAEHRDAYIGGYTTVSPWAFDDTELAGLIVGRGLLLLCDVLQSTNPEFQAFAPAFIERIELRCRAFLDRGGWW